MNFQINVSDIIAFVALLLSGYTIKKTIDFNKRQNEFIETNDKLNKLLIEKENEDSLTKKKADLSANFVNLGKSEYRLKIFNRGYNFAKNVRIEILEGNDLFIENDVNSKFPIEILERQQGVELITPFESGSSSKAKIKLIWDDETGNDRFNIITPIV